MLSLILNNFHQKMMYLVRFLKGAIGDAFVQLEQLDDAYDYYVQAAKLKSNTYTTPMYLYKAGSYWFKNREI